MSASCEHFWKVVEYLGIPFAVVCPRCYASHWLKDVRVGPAVAD